MTQAIYGTRAGMEAMFGRENVTKWADADGTKQESVVAARIAWALEEASAFVENRLAGRRWLTPFDAPWPAELVSNVNRYAGVLLYEAPRGQEDSQEEGGKHNLSAHRRRVLYWLRDVRAGRATLGIDEDAGIVTTPQID